MIIIMKESASAKEIERLKNYLPSSIPNAPYSRRKEKQLSAQSATSAFLSMNQILTMDGVENVVPIMKPYKLASKELHKEPSVIEIGSRNNSRWQSSLQYLQASCAIEARNSSQLYQRLLRPLVQTFFAAVRSSLVHHHIHSKVLRVTRFEDYVQQRSGT